MNSQEIKDISLMYEAVYNDELREKANEYNSIINEDLQQKVGQALDAAAKNPVVKAIGSVIAPVGKGRKTPTATSGGYRPVKEDMDLFDYLLEYLVAEGYADTNQDALVLMANMTQDDINDFIIERRREERDQPRRESEPAVQEVKKTIRRMEGKPKGQQKKVPGQKPPVAGEYGSGTFSPAQKVAKRREAAQKAQEFMSDTRGT